MTIPVEVTRHVKEAVQRTLWGRAAGRCEFAGCNKPLWKSSVTHEPVNIAQKAHIYSFSDGGVRGNDMIRKDKLNDLENLMLVCHECHQKMDKETDGGRYTAELLKKWKAQHEERIERVTGIDPTRTSHVVLYGANIGEHVAPLTYEETAGSLFPHRYPAEDRAIQLGVVDGAGRDIDPHFWRNEGNDLSRKFEQRVKPSLADGTIKHVSVFALAPQPLLVCLGALMTDIANVDVYQLHREPQTWNWLEGPDGFDYLVEEPPPAAGEPALVLALSATVTDERIAAVLGEEVSIWRVTIAEPHNDFLKSREQLARFRELIRPLMDKIKAVHGQNTMLHIFSAAPVAIAVELGRIRQPKADMSWRIYDQVKDRGFAPAIDVPLGGSASDRCIAVASCAISK